MHPFEMFLDKFNPVIMITGLNLSRNISNGCIGPSEKVQMLKAIIFGLSWTTGLGQMLIKTAMALYLSIWKTGANGPSKKAAAGSKPFPIKTDFNR